MLLIVAVGSTGWLYYQKKELSQEYKKAQEEWFREEQKLSQSLEGAKKSINKFKNKLGEVERELRSAHSELHNVKEEKENLEGQIEVQKTQLKKLRTNLERKQEKISELERKNKTYIEHFKELEDDYKDLYSKTAEDYDVPSSKFSEKLSQWAKQKDNLKDELQNLSEKLKSSDVEREELIKDMNKVNSLLKKRIVKIATFKKKLDELKKKSKQLAMEKAFNTVSSVKLPSIVINKGSKDEGLLFSDTKSNIRKEKNKSMTSKKSSIVNKKNEGKILVVNQAENFVVLNLGKKDGIEKGMIFEVFRNEGKIGKVKVMEVREDLCAANIEKVIYGRLITANDKVRLYH